MRILGSVIAVPIVAAFAAIVVQGQVSAAPRFATSATTIPHVRDAALRPLATHDARPDFSDPVVPGPKIHRPNTPSCTVTLLSNQPFENFTPATGSYAAPATCPGPWSKVVLDWNVSVQGVQFDRLGAVWLGGTEIFHFTTSEPPGPQISWHVEKDVSEYANTLGSASDFTVSLGNVVNGTYTGIYYVTATLTFYEPGTGWPAKAQPDLVVPISQYPQQSPPWFTLNTPMDQASATVNLPRNLQDATLEVYTTGHGCDEFWYAQESTAYEQSIGQSCGGSAYREIDVSIDGKPAGIVAPYPYLYTGAIDPILWLPITGHDTLDIPAYRVDLSPWVGILANGQPHTIAASVYNNFGYWVCDANLLVDYSGSSAPVSGRLTHLDAGPANFEHVDETHLNAAGGHATYAAHHFLRAEGYVDLPGGRVRHHVNEQIAFHDYQNFNNNSGAFAVKSTETDTTRQHAVSRTGADTTTISDSYPLALDLTSAVVISQGFYESVSSQHPRRSSVSFLQEAIDANDTPGHKTLTTDHFLLTGSNGPCFDEYLSASQGVLIHDKKSPRCNR